MHKLIYKEEEIPYELIRKKIKNLYISIKDGIVIVRAPIKLKEKYINEFLEKKIEWIYNGWKESLENKKNVRKISNDEVIFLEKYSKLLNVKPKKVRIKDIKYAWRKLFF